MKIFVSILILISTTLLRPAIAQSSSEVIDGIAAIVNGDVITYSQVRELIGARERALRDTFRGDDLANKIKEMRLAALKDLIDRQLILQEFKKRELNIPEFVVEDRVQQIIREEFGGDRSAFVRTLRSQGYTLSRFREVEREKIIVQAMRQANVKDEFVISPTKIQAFYDKNKQSYASPEQVRLRMIVLRETDDDVAEMGGKLAMAQEIREKLKDGADFGMMAQMYSEDPTTQMADGDWGWIDKNTLSEDLTQRAFSLRAGEISEVIQLGNSYYIMMIDERQEATVKSISEVRDEIEQNLMQQERMDELQRWLDTLREKAYIKIYS